MKFKSVPEQFKEIVIVDIDNTSIEKIGRWPWPRSIIADGITKISSGKPKVIGLNIILSEPEQNAGIDELNKLEAIFINNFLDASQEKGVLFLQSIDEARKSLNNDQKLSEAIKHSGNIVLPVFFNDSSPTVQKIPGTGNPMAKHTIKNIRIPANAHIHNADKITNPLQPFFENAKGIGHINFGPDIDGIIRRDRLLYNYKVMYVP